MCRAGGGGQRCSKPARHERPHLDAPCSLPIVFNIISWKVRGGAAPRDERTVHRVRRSRFLGLAYAIGRKRIGPWGPAPRLHHGLNHGIGFPRLSKSTADLRFCCPEVRGGAAVRTTLPSEGRDLCFQTCSRLVVEKRFGPSGPALRQLLDARLETVIPRQEERSTR